MSEKALKVLFVSLAALLILWLGISLLGGRGGGGSRQASSALAGVLEGVEPDRVEEVRIRKSGSDTLIVLRRREGQWTVNGFAPDSAAVADFWSALQKAELVELAARNPANHRRMGLAADSTWVLELVVGGRARTLLVGNPGARWGTVYVRHPEEDAVYLLKGHLRSEVTRRLDDWRNRRVARVDTGQVARVELERGGKLTVLVRSAEADSVWTKENGDRVDTFKVWNLLSDLAYLDASGFVAPGDSLPPREGFVTAFNRAGDTLYHLEIGKGGDLDRWARVRGDTVLYKIPAWRLARLLPESWD